MDHVVVLPRFPDRDTKCGVVAQWRQVGGPVPVALSTASFYGMDTMFSGRWGDDAAGREIRKVLTNRGLDLKASQSRDDWTTGFAQVWTEEADGTRTIACSRGDFPEPTADDLKEHASTLDACQILHIDGWAPSAALYAASRMKENGGLVVLDAGSKKPLMEELLPFVNVLIASNLFCLDWFGTPKPSRGEVASLGCPTIIRTAGADGATCHENGQRFHVTAEKVDAIDTNGAGDIFAGALLVGLSEGRAMQDAMAFANSVASRSCQHRGNSTLPARSDVA